MTKTRSLISLGLIFLISALGHATTVQRLDLDGLVKKAHKIVLGKVRSSRTYWSDDHKLILTSYTLDVSETMKGASARTLEVTTIGGTIGDLTLQVPGMPIFARDENSVVFVEDTGAYSTVVGLAQGKFTVTNGEVSNSVRSLEFPGGGLSKDTKMPLATFRLRIRSIVDR